MEDFFSHMKPTARSVWNRFFFKIFLLSFAWNGSVADPVILTGDEIPLKKNRYYRNDSLPVKFLIPEDSVETREPRGNHSLIQIRPFLSDNFLIFFSVFRPVEEKAFEENAQILSMPCPSSSIPAAKEFQYQVQCEFTTGGNRLVRRILWIRKEGEILGFFLTHRAEYREVAERILQSVDFFPGP